ncbi:MAG TPA: PD-(D/E)XK nuclease domain-containing protein [Candidatus Anaerobiospirillum stercoravium]|nr:PD-(D/E)XK nuclease domain-containing protein [Candidatus Anaerobiospirillum stercoravium]
MNFITAPSGDHDQEFKHTAEQLNLALKALDIASAVQALNTFLSTLPYDVWVKNIEATYRTFIHLFLIFSELSPVRAETYNSQGRFDLEVEFDRKLLVIELKRLEPGAQHKACLNLVQQAQDQIVKRGYGHNLDTWQKPPLKERKGLVLVLSDDTHQIVYWRLLSLEQAPQKVQVLGEDWGAPLAAPKAQLQKAQGHTTPALQTQSAATAATSSADTSAAATSTQVTTSRSAATNAAAAPAAAATNQDSQKVEVITPSTLSIILSMSKPQAQTTDQVELNGEAFINGVMDFVAQLQEPNARFSADQITATVQMIIDLAHNKTSPHPVLVDRTDLVRTLVARLSQLN